MRILYGVVGEGMGHAMRSRVVLEHLVAQGHEVEVTTSGRAIDYLKKRFPEVHAIRGLTIHYEANEVQRAKTFLANLVGGAAALPKNVDTYFKMVDDFRPEAVISDFESWTHIYGMLHGIPVISIDNMQIMNRCKIPRDITKGFRGDFRIQRAFVKGKLPGCQHYLITTFFHPKIRRKRTTLVPPVLRREILDAKSSAGDHLLVYQTAEGHDELVDTLASTGLECRIYGMRRNITEEQVEGNLRYRPFSESVFIEDVASARAVIAGGGFTLMSECVYLHKPMLSVPVARQSEQLLNARYLEREGYGMFAENLDDPKTVHEFLERVPDCAKALSKYRQDGNKVLFEAVDHELDRVAAGV